MIRLLKDGFVLHRWEVVDMRERENFHSQVRVRALVLS